MTDAEIAGYMNWRGPGAYTAHHMKRLKRLIYEVQQRQREACASVCESLPMQQEIDVRDQCAKAIREMELT